MGEALSRLLQRLDLQHVGDDELLDPGAPDSLLRVFGGQVAAQALLALGRTVAPDRPVHSLHVHFLGLARPAEPLLFRVTRLKEGASFDVRQVSVLQRDRVVLTATGSFQAHEPGPEHPLPVRALPDPATLPRWEEQFSDRRDRLTMLWRRSRPVDLRFIDPPHLDPLLSDRPRDRMRVLWRSDGPLPDDPLLHACLAVYAADTTLLETALLPHGTVFADGRFHAASLDHSMWFHAPLQADDWLLHDQSAEATGGGRGFATGRTYDLSGRLVVSAAQEGLLRPAGPDGARVGEPAGRALRTPDVVEGATGSPEPARQDPRLRFSMMW